MLEVSALFGGIYGGTQLLFTAADKSPSGHSTTPIYLPTSMLPSSQSYHHLTFQVHHLFIAYHIINK